MSFDGLFTRAMVKELTNIKGGKISKIHQPYKNELILIVRVTERIISYFFQHTQAMQEYKLQMKHMKTRTNHRCFACYLRKHLEGAIF